MTNPMKTRERPQAEQKRPAPEYEGVLSPGGAFVVQFREGADDVAARFMGRVEHVLSGHAARFGSPDELLAFFGLVLRTARTKHPERSCNGDTKLPATPATCVHLCG